MAGVDVRRLAVSSSPKLTPDEIASRSFAKALRGVSESEVRSFLGRIAEEVAAISEREFSLRTRIGDLEEQLRSPKAPTDQELLTALGEETARVLRSAQSAAEDIRSRSEERAAAVLKDADEQAKSMREAAEEAATSQVNLANETSIAQIAAAEASSAGTKAAATADATTIFEIAARDAAEVRERARIESEGEIEQARQTGREMLAEAKAVRERVLADLARRRELLTSQIEELRTGRDRLLDAYRVVKQTLSDATSALGQVDSKGASALATSAPFTETYTGIGNEDESDESLSQVATAVPKVPSLEAPSANSVLINSAPNTREQSKPEDTQSDPLNAAPNSAINSPTTGRSLRRRVRESLGITEDFKAEASTGTTEEIAPPLTESVTVVIPGDKSRAKSRANLTADLRADSDAPEVESIFARLRADGAEPVSTAKLEDASPDKAETRSTDINSGSADSSTKDSTKESADDNTEGSTEDSASDERSMCEAVLIPLRRDALKRAKRALQDDQNALLERLRTQKGRIDPEVILGDGVAQSDAWEALLREPITKAFVGAHTTLTTEPSPNIPAELTSRPIQELVGGLRTRLSGVIAANDAPDADDSISRAVSSCFRDARGQGLEAALGDALSAAWSRGVYEAVAPKTLLRWVPMEAGKCSDCDDNALEPTPRGEKFPTGQAYPPAHPGCRCLITPAASLG